ncbi:acyltransferase [Nocardiopsis aegyptia]|uniref:Surface polysaccharide O-acyltransferase-like enzyme n=1 Tax=Nocardiopsis aegyptia TaxID=220378 RepID=A0A7Z0EQS3_9ACTN|nr:acyltransferase family protein [Nocardiopsis aegyptia]NYJ35698.1 surface polysaccharide O-acyltransferase-like enzyme [Nocardiopsis aegyptia]
MAVDVTPAGRPASAPPSPAPTTNWVGFARVAAMVAVVLVHAFSPLVSTAHADLGGPAWWAAHVLDSALRWCVPVFVMISGGLLLRPREEDAGAFYRRRWAKIGVPLVVWSVAYLVWEQWRDGLDPAGAVAEAASGSPSIHLYFLYVIAGLYLLTPFLRTVVAHTPRTGLWWFAGTMLALGATDQLLGLVDGAGGVTAATRFLPFLGYYLLGWLLMTSTAGKRNLRYGIAAFTLGTAATVTGAWAGAAAEGDWGRGAEYVYGYLSPTVVVASLGALLLLRAAGERLAGDVPDATRFGRVVGTVSGLSFGVYLVHVMVLNTLRDIGGTPGGVLVLAAASGYAVATAAVSLLLVAAMRRIPLLRSTV